MLNPCFFFLFLVSPRLSFSLSLNETIVEIGRPVHYLTQLFILWAHFMLVSHTSVDNALWLCIRKSVCLSLPLDFSRAGPVGHTLSHPTHLGSPHSDPWSLRTACSLAWGQAEVWGKDKGELIATSAPLIVSGMSVPCRNWFSLIHHRCLNVDFRASSGLLQVITDHFCFVPLFPTIPSHMPCILQD